MSHSKSAQSIASSCKPTSPTCRLSGWCAASSVGSETSGFPPLPPLAKSASNIPKPLIALPHNGRPPVAVPKGTRQRGTCSPLFGSRSESGPRSRGPDRNGAREGLGLALLAAQRTGKGCSSPHGLGPADGLPQPFLFLPVGCRMGCHVLEDQRLCSLSDLALAEWT